MHRLVVAAKNAGSEDSLARERDLSYIIRQACMSCRYVVTTLMCEDYHNEKDALGGKRQGLEH
jgi:hypothetical protein